MSGDNEKKPEALDFSDLGFDPFADSGIAQAEKKEQPPVPNAADSGFDLPAPAGVSAFPEELPAPSPLLLGDNDETPLVGSLTDTPESTESTVDDSVPAAAIEEAGKKGKKKKEKKVKPVKEKKPSDGNKEPLGVGGVFCLVSGFVLLAILLLVDALMFVKPSLVLGETAGVGSGITLYVVFFTVIGLAGVVSVPFMFFANRKEMDVFKAVLGVSVMALSAGVLFLMTEHLRYDFPLSPGGIKAPPVSALSMPKGERVPEPAQVP